MDFLSLMLRQVTLKDFVDISIVALMIYQVLSIVQGTRAVQVLFGMVLLSLLYVLGVNYNFYTLNWILDHFFDYFFIIFTIIFQDQIRAALANLGTGKKVFRMFEKASLALDIEEIIRVASVLSKEKTGGIIVVERKNGLENYVQTGTRLDSRLHSDLIYSIFQPTSPLHDGAIIIKDNLILAAGCFLPLSKNVDIDKHLGTRHRAAIGITEVSDAVVVTISEETGKISTCINGIFTLCTTENDLRKNLVSYIGSTKEFNSKSKKRIS